MASALAQGPPGPEAILRVEGLSVDFHVRGRWLPAVSGVSFEVARGEVLALVGESGSGKSVTCLSLARLVEEPAGRYTAGRVLLRGPGGAWADVLSMPLARLRAVRGRRIAYVFQEPSVSLNPVFTVGDQLAEALPDSGLSPLEAEKLCASLLARVGIADPLRLLRCYPHEMSGGMQQRVMIAMALAGGPELLVADEPTTALDVTIQAQILDLLRSIRNATGMAIVFVTHNLGIVSELADRLCVMYAGRIVESGPVRAVVSAPAHPYTARLIEAVPRLGHPGRLATIPGAAPSPADYPPGCRFFGRCQRLEASDAAASRRCAAEDPGLRPAGPGRFCRCHYHSSHGGGG